MDKAIVEFCRSREKLIQEKQKIDKNSAKSRDSISSILKDCMLNGKIECIEVKENLFIRIQKCRMPLLKIDEVVQLISGMGTQIREIMDDENFESKIIQIMKNRLANRRQAATKMNISIVKKPLKNKTVSLISVSSQIQHLILSFIEISHSIKQENDVIKDFRSDEKATETKILQMLKSTTSEISVKMNKNGVSFDMKIGKIDKFRKTSISLKMLMEICVQATKLCKTVDFEQSFIDSLKFHLEKQTSVHEKLQVKVHKIK
jgi:hypothetical protein